MSLEMIFEHSCVHIEEVEVRLVQMKPVVELFQVIADVIEQLAV